MDTPVSIDVPPLPGLYIVTVDCDEPISVNASDARIANRCITINRENCKFGRAKNLRSRYHSYQNTFSPHSVNFRVVALVDDFKEAEGACATKLQPWRVRGPTGRLNEWLSGISPAGVEAIVMQTLKVSGFDFRRYV
jgi:hypothetical protein